MMDIDLFDKIFLDVDGCLINSVEAMVKLLNNKYGTNVCENDILSWNFNEVKSDLTTKDIEDLFNNPKFFEIVEFYDGAIEFLTKNGVTINKAKTVYRMVYGKPIDWKPNQIFGRFGGNLG